MNETERCSQTVCVCAHMEMSGSWSGSRFRGEEKYKIDQCGVMKLKRNGLQLFLSKTNYQKMIIHLQLLVYAKYCSSIAVCHS